MRLKYLPASLIALLFCTTPSASVYPSETAMRQAIHNGARMLRAEGIEIEVRNAQESKVNLPLMSAGLNLTSGVCMVFFNTLPEEGLRKFFDPISEEEMPVLLEAIVVHETTHCVEQREAYVRKDFGKVLPADVDSNNMTIQGYLSVVKSGAVENWGEALADIASVLHLRRTVPDRWLYYANHIAAMRRDSAKKWPEHDTSPWLEKLIADDTKDIGDQNLFELAFQLRERYRPN